MYLSTIFVLCASFVTLQLAGALSTRARIAHDQLNKYAAHPDYGASLEEIRTVSRKRALEPRNSTVNPDLVSLLIEDNQDIWQQLLHNPFVEAMRTAGPDNQTVTTGFQWYEVQDFWYCARLLFFDVARAQDAITATDFNTSVNEVASDGVYAMEALQTCILPEPSGLGLNETKVLTAGATAALNQYSDFLYVSGKDYNWVVALAAMIPCIQSYYYIASELNSTSSFQDTIWWNLWVQDNLDFSYNQNQIDFFIANYDYWNDFYEDATIMFRKGCLSEINLWAVAWQPGDI